ncbi:MAG: transcriptional activator domain protein [Candidatus Eremiobacteraeota bacterium]|nr:transcriptional activator domain protein [Candidatus Eremiobacteraeota bacterium]
MTAPIRIALFGALRIVVGGQPIRLAAPPMTFPLLAYLLVHRDRNVARETLAFTLWPEESESAAKANLRRHLHYLQRLLPPPPDGVSWVIADARAVRWNPNAPAEIDVAEFERRIGEGERSEAVALYEGDLLEELDSEWILTERERLRTLHVDNLSQLIAAARAERRFGRALQFARRLLHHDPWREDAVREVVSLRFELGDRAGAIAEFDAFAERLDEEMGAEPMPESLALRELISHDEVPERAQPRGERRDIVPWAVLPFAGRDREVEEMRDAWDRAVRGDGSLMLIGGEAGIGKTRLCAIVRQIALGDGGVVLDGSTSFPESTPYQPFAEALEPLVATLDISRFEPIFLSALALVIPQIRALHPTLPPLPAVDPGHEQTRMYEAFFRAGEVVSEKRPLLLVLEDMQWAGAATIALLEYAARRAPTRKLLIVASYRAEDVPRDHPLRAVRRRLEREGRAGHLALGPLAPRDVETILTTLAGSGVDPGTLGAELHAESEGNPFFLGELLRGAVEQGAVRVDDGRLAIARAASITPGIRETIAARLQRLSPDALGAAEFAAVIGRAFNVELLSEASGWTEARAIAAVSELLDRHIVRDAGAANDYTFSHNLVQSTIYALSSRRELERRHGRIAIVMEDLNAGMLDDIAAQIALHFERGGEGERAAHYYMRAARRALALFATYETAEYLERALTLSTDWALRADALLLQEEVHRRNGDRDAQRDDLDQLAILPAGTLDPDRACEVLRRRIALAHVTGEREDEERFIAELHDRAELLDRAWWEAVALQLEGQHLLASGRLDEARTVLERALTIPAVRDDPALATDVFCNLATVADHQADYEVAERYLQRALALVETQSDELLRFRVLNQRYAIAHVHENYVTLHGLARELLERTIAVGDRRAEMLAHLRLANAALFVFEIAEAYEQYERADAMADLFGTPKERASVAACRGIFASAVGDFDTARAHLIDARDIASDAADRFGELLADVNMAYVEIFAEEPEEALALADAAVPAAHAINSDLIEASALCAQGAALRRLDRDDALASLERGIALQRELGLHSSLGQDLAELALAQLAAGELDAACKTAVELNALADTSYHGLTHPHFMLWTAALVHDTLGDRERADALFREAYALYENRLGRLAEPKLRDCFSRIWFNRRIVAEGERRKTPVDVS